MTASCSCNHPASLPLSVCGFQQQDSDIMQLDRLVKFQAHGQWQKWSIAFSIPEVSSPLSGVSEPRTQSLTALSNRCFITNLLISVMVFFWTEKSPEILKSPTHVFLSSYPLWVFLASFLAHSTLSGPGHSCGDLIPRGFRSEFMFSQLQIQLVNLPFDNQKLETLNSVN